MVFKDEGINLKALIFKIQDYVKEVWDKKWIIFAFVLVVGVYRSVSAWFTPPKYVATLTYMVNEDEGGGGGLGALIGQIGIGLPYDKTEF